MRLESARLTLELFSTDDLDFLFELHSDEQVMRYIHAPLEKKEDAQPFLDKCLRFNNESNGLGIWKARLKESSDHIGWFCLKPLDNTPHIEIGYRLARKYWGQGYGTEMSSALVTYGFQKLALNRIVGITRIYNVASRRVLEKCNLVFSGYAYYYNTVVTFYTLKKGE